MMNDRTIMMALVFPVVVLAVAACAKERAPERAKQAPPPKSSGPIEIAVTPDGFQPEKVVVPKGKPITLGFTRTTDKTCATEVILQVDEATKVERKLPLNERVEVVVTFPKAGELRYACGMDMISGVISVM